MPKTRFNYLTIYLVILSLASLGSLWMAFYPENSVALQKDLSLFIKIEVAYLPFIFALKVAYQSLRFNVKDHVIRLWISGIISLIFLIYLMSAFKEAFTLSSNILLCALLLLIFILRSYILLTKSSLSENAHIVIFSMISGGFLLLAENIVEGGAFLGSLYLFLQLILYHLILIKKQSIKDAFTKLKQLEDRVPSNTPTTPPHKSLLFVHWSSVLLNLGFIGTILYLWIAPQNVDIKNIELFISLLVMEFFVVMAILFIGLFPPLITLYIIFPIIGIMILIFFGITHLGVDLFIIYIVMTLSRILNTFTHQEDPDTAMSSAVFPAIWFFISIMITFAFSDSTIPELGLSMEHLQALGYTIPFGGVFTEFPPRAFFFGVIYFVGFVLWEFLLLYITKSSRKRIIIKNAHR